MTRYRKKPVVVDAWQWHGDFTDAPAWVLGQMDAGELTATRDSSAFGDTRRIRVETREGVMFAWPGYWIIRGVQGELYPCKPDIFAATYDPVDEDVPPVVTEHIDIDA